MTLDDYITLDCRDGNCSACETCSHHCHAGLRVLTVRQPWADAIINLGKDVENRTRNIAGAYKGPVAIHAAKQLLPIDETLEAGKFIGDLTGYMPLFTMPAGRGAILGVVDLTETHPESRSHPCDCSDWAEIDRWHLVLANPRPLTEPIPFKGALGLRRLPDDVAEQVWAAVAA